VMSTTTEAFFPVSDRDLPNLANLGKSPTWVSKRALQEMEFLTSMHW
jgi:hypothetical protein